MPSCLSTFVFANRSFCRSIVKSTPPPSAKANNKKDAQEENCWSLTRKILFVFVLCVSLKLNAIKSVAMLRYILTICQPTQLNAANEWRQRWKPFHFYFYLCSHSHIEWELEKSYKMIVVSNLIDFYFLRFSWISSRMTKFRKIIEVSGKNTPHCDYINTDFDARSKQVNILQEILFNSVHTKSHSQKKSNQIQRVESNQIMETNGTK